MVENNFRKIVKNHYLALLEAKRIYWKQRNTVRWVHFGDENTKLFQLMATIRHQRYNIARLTLADGTILEQHHEKEEALWNSFRERLGISECNEMLFDLTTLIQAAQLQAMDQPFSKEEIDAALKDMHSNHALGPDGFNGAFIKNAGTSLNPIS